MRKTRTSSWLSAWRGPWGGPVPDALQAGTALEDFRAVFHEFWPIEVAAFRGNPYAERELLRMFPEEDFRPVFGVLYEAASGGDLTLYLGVLEVMKHRCFERYTERKEGRSA